MEKENIKYYYVNGDKSSVGPFTLQEFLNLQLSLDTLVWFTGLDKWRPLHEFDFLLPKSVEPREDKLQAASTHIKVWLGANKKILCILLSSISLLFLVVILSKCNSNAVQKRHIAEQAYDNEELYTYLETFYRDLEFFGINKKKSKSVCLKMAPMQYFEDTKDYYGVSYGYDNDDVIEIYINEDGWSKLNRAQKYALMYHEFGHDILNLKDLPDTPDNYNKLMGPCMNRFDHLSMDQFIDMSHEVFNEILN